MNPRNTVFDAKRLIGRKFDDTSVQMDMKHWPFTVLKGPEGKPIIEGMHLCLLAGSISSSFDYGVSHDGAWHSCCFECTYAQFFAC